MQTKIMMRRKRRAMAHEELIPVKYMYYGLGTLVRIFCCLKAVLKWKFGKSSFRSKCGGPTVTRLHLFRWMKLIHMILLMSRDMRSETSMSSLHIFRAVCTSTYSTYNNFSPRSYSDQDRPMYMIYCTIDGKAAAYKHRRLADGAICCLITSLKGLQWSLLQLWMLRTLEFLLSHSKSDTQRQSGKVNQFRPLARAKLVFGKKQRRTL